jgi:uncharacterized membrane protein YdjX (TVP38/TMEM64 family)
MNGRVDEPAPHEDRSRRLLKRELRSVVPLVLAILGIVAVVILLGHEAQRHVHAIEAWIANLGPWGRLAFVGLLVVGSTVLIPESLFGLAAGALFGLAWGTGLILAGNIIAATLQYTLARRLLHVPIQKALEKRPLLRAIQSAVMRNEIRLQVLLRLTPLNPALISYLLGAAGVRYIGFILSTLVLASHFVIEVYIGDAGKQLVAHGFKHAEGGWQHSLMIYGGAAVGLIAIALVSKAAHRAVIKAIAENAETDTVDERD